MSEEIELLVEDIYILNGFIKLTFPSSSNTDIPVFKLTYFGDLYMKYVCP